MTEIGIHFRLSDPTAYQNLATRSSKRSLNLLEILHGGRRSAGAEGKTDVLGLGGRKALLRSGESGVDWRQTCG